MVGQGAQRHGRRLGSGSGNSDILYRQLIEHLNERIGCGALWNPDISKNKKQAGNRNSPASPPPRSPDERSEDGDLDKHEFTHSLLSGIIGIFFEPCDGRESFLCVQKQLFIPY